MRWNLQTNFGRYLTLPVSYLAQFLCAPDLNRLILTLKHGPIPYFLPIKVQLRRTYYPNALPHLNGGQWKSPNRRLQNGKHHVLPPLPMHECHNDNVRHECGQCLDTLKCDYFDPTAPHQTPYQAPPNLTIP